MSDRHPLYASADIQLIRSDLEPMYELSDEDYAETVRELRLLLATTARLLEEGDALWLAQVIAPVVRSILEDYEPEKLYNHIINELANLMAIVARVSSEIGHAAMAIDLVEEAWEILLNYDSDVAEFVRQTNILGETSISEH